MITLGLDLAAEPKNTSGCAVEWRNCRAAVRWVATGLTDDDILSHAQEVSVLGIDAPFGWPESYVKAITAHHAGEHWPVEAWDKPNRRSLRLRATDEQVHAVTGITPLSVSSDAIAIPATRCASLIDRLGVRDRSGDGHVHEVYPAAALLQWGLRHKGYKGKKNVGRLLELLVALRRRAPWLDVLPRDAEVLSSCDHAFDALIASLAARAALRGLTFRPTADQLDLARVEGWIAVPRTGSLEDLPLAAEESRTNGPRTEA